MTSDAELEDGFARWIGREQRAQDRLDEALAARWLATFDLPKHSASKTGIMPQGIHFALCTPENATADLGEDGHPARDTSADSFLPPFPMPRRMWASSSIEFRAPLAIGASVERTSRVASITQKNGSSGKLAFVNIEHETTADGALALLEAQTLVYRDSAPPSAPLSPPIDPPIAEDGDFDASAWDAVRTLTPGAPFLMRYSALTFNTHRIHYDAPYASEVERYRGLVVHGPLIASLLLQLAESQLGSNQVRRFEFRGLSPAIAGDQLHLAMRKHEDGYELGAFAAGGRQINKASATL